MRFLARCILGVLLAATAVAQESPFGTYTYDGSGNITSIANGTSADRFVYDELGRLKSATLRQGPAQTFTYDRYGNILTVTTSGDPVDKKLGVDKHTNQLDQVLDDNGQANNVVGTYDARGNLISYDQGTFVYDGLELIKEATVDAVRRFHVYTATDERVLTISSDGTAVVGDWTIRDPANRPLRRFTETNGTFAWTADYIYRDGELLATAVPTAEKIRHFHLDHLGTPRLVTGNGGAQVAEHHYHPFGAELPSSTIDNEKAKFTGHERDASTLDYMHARFYDPYMGRFLSIDPYLDLQKATRNPQNWNRYSYVSNNPINLIDPDGRDDVNIGPDFEVAGAPNPEKDKAFRKEVTDRVLGGISLAIATVFLDGGPEMGDGERPRATRPSAMSPGPHASESIPARDSQPKFTPEERAKINEIGKKSGCHMCGATNPRTKSGNFVPDHQPPSATKPPAQQLYPHCINCSRTQGGQVRKFLLELVKKIL